MNWLFGQFVICIADSNAICSLRGETTFLGYNEEKGLRRQERLHKMANLKDFNLNNLRKFNNFTLSTLQRMFIKNSIRN